MKKILFFSLALSLAAAFVACNNDTQQYKDLLKKERKAIDDYIKYKNITVLDKKPDTDRVYGKDTFFRASSGLYFRLEKKGEGEDTVKIGQLVLYNFYKITLDAAPDTVMRYWKSSIDYHPSPEFLFGRDYPYPCIAFHEAVGLMKKTESQAQLIVPSAIGFSNENIFPFVNDNKDVMPYLFTLRIKLAD